MAKTHNGFTYYNEEYASYEDGAALVEPEIIDTNGYGFISVETNFSLTNMGSSSGVSFELVGSNSPTFAGSPLQISITSYSGLINSGGAYYTGHSLLFYKTFPRYVKARCTYHGTGTEGVATISISVVRTEE